MSGNLRIATKAAGAGVPPSVGRGLSKPGASHDGFRNGLAHGTEGATSQALTIIVIDRRVLIRECLVRCLTSMGDNCIVQDFATVADWQMTGDHPSAAVIILCTQDRQDIETERDLSQLAQDGTRIPVVVLSDAENADHILAALECGARGYIPTSMSLDVAVSAMRLVEAGGTFVPASTIFSSRPKDAVEHKSDVRPGRFTTRQAAVIDALRQGKANKEIAYELNMREGTVKVHVRNIMKKLNARNRTEVAMLTSGVALGADEH